MFRKPPSLQFEVAAVHLRFSKHSLGQIDCLYLLVLATRNFRIFVSY